MALETALNTASSFQQQHQQQQQHSPPGAGPAPRPAPPRPSPGSEGAAGGRQRVFSLTLVRGTPFYGYHAGAGGGLKWAEERGQHSAVRLDLANRSACPSSCQLCPAPTCAEECVWIKVLMYNPRDVSRAAELLRVGGLRRNGASTDLRTACLCSRVKGLAG